ncbi:TolC family protein [Alistipes sp.]|uniref:TolC family protein n=1 Tax=Alistipes sp. TaxID=1872444 RepID=UPI003A857828
MRRLLILWVLLAGLPLQAQPTLDECRELARRHYPAIRQYDLIRRTEAYNLSNAARNRLPQLSFSAQATWQTDVPTLPDALTEMLDRQNVSMPGLHKDQYKVMLEVNQVIWDGGRIAAGRGLSEAESAADQRAADVDLYALEARIDDLYFGILLFDERIARMQLTIDLLQSNLDKLRAYVRNGVAMASDADAVEAELLAAGQQLGEYEARRDSYRRMLALFVGRDLEARPLVRPAVADAFSDVAERSTAAWTDDVAGRPEMAWFDARTDLVAARERQLKVATRPRFGLFAQGYYGYPGLDYFRSMISPDWSWNALVGVRMSWSFGGYYTRKNSLGKLHVERDRIEMQRDLFRFNTRLQAVEENGEVVRLRRALADDDRIVALRRSVREAAESKLRNGVIDTDELLRRITEENLAAMARSARELELLKTIYELKHTLNR